MTAKLQDEAKQRYNLSANNHSLSAKDWHHKGLILIDLIQHDLLKINIQPLHEKLTLINRWFSYETHNPSSNLLLLDTIQHGYHQYNKQLITIYTTIENKINNAYKSAIQYFHQAIHAYNEKGLVFKNTIKSDLIECLAQYGHYLYKNKFYEKAQKYYIQAIKLDPEHITALNQMGMCLSKRKSYNEARAYFEEIISRNSNPQEQADAWLNIAYTYRLQRNYPKSAKALRESQRLSPHDPAIKNEEKKLRKLVSSTAFASTRHILSDMSLID